MLTAFVTIALIYLTSWVGLIIWRTICRITRPDYTNWKSRNGKNFDREVRAIQPIPLKNTVLLIGLICVRIGAAIDKAKVEREVAKAVTRMSNEFGYKDWDDLLAAVANGEIRKEAVVERLEYEKIKMKLKEGCYETRVPGNTRSYPQSKSYLN